jgi:hypothetical protein
MQERLARLEREVAELRRGRDVYLDRAVDAYLADADPAPDAHTGAQGGGGLTGLRLTARGTAVVQGTMGLNPTNRTVANGDFDLDFDLAVTENLDLYLHLTASTTNEGGDSFPGLFGGDSFDGGMVGTGFAFPAIASPTLAGLSDGIGVNGTVPTDPGSITVYEAGIHYVLHARFDMHIEIGAMDPRTRFLQNAFADDENTQFIHNLFDDPSAVLWATDASGRTVFGAHAWVPIGEGEQIKINWGWFNRPGQFFSRGQAYVQVHWRFEAGDRVMNLRIMGFLDELFRDAGGDGSAGGGVSWDFQLNEKMGIFVRASTNGDNVNPVEFDVAFGIVWTGTIPSRPDDVFGIAVGFADANATVVPGLPEERELTVEFYYRYMMEDGKLQISPHIIYVQDPGGGGGGWQDDTLFILGVRIHVPF